MFKVQMVSKINSKTKQRICYFTKKEDAENLVNSLNKKDLIPYYRVRVSDSVFKSFPSEILSELITKKDGNYIIMNVDAELNDSIFKHIRDNGKRSFPSFFASSEFSIKKTISKNNLSLLDKDISEHIAKALHFFKKNIAEYSIEIKEVKLH